ncbi:MAG: hypothetical protein A2157_02515 [Deltaproteobacteria bacterium RBG_16_47_11]|nr:MAG: hypothetical protein A2157_02515 [Deltaproteobacteria bacterium RBG_16_47_11]
MSNIHSYLIVGCGHFGSRAAEMLLKTNPHSKITMVDQKPRPGAHNTKVAFVHPKSSGGVLIELCEFPKNG